MVRLVLEHTIITICHYHENGEIRGRLQLVFLNKEDVENPLLLEHVRGSDHLRGCGASGCTFCLGAVVGGCGGG
eukprot:14788503-Alexandrium_andersonii.AAC.1